MKFKFILFFSIVFLLSCNNREANNNEIPEKHEYAIVIHGGAGNILKENMTDEKEAEYRSALNEALSIGTEILKNGGTSLDAVEKTINFLENNPLFNAGKGAVFTHDGINELDASIMDGDELDAGAVGGVTIIKNPISAARAVMEKSPHVMMVRAGAEQFAIDNGLDTVSTSYFYTEKSWNGLQRAIANEKDPDEKHGTVGCVALDKNGTIAAGTSTGGMTNKRNNRIGDSPIIGAGTYADSKVGGVSCTGHGEFFIRHAVAKDLIDRMSYIGETVSTAGDYIINLKLKDLGASGGLIAMDSFGNIAMPFNTSGMFRGYANPEKTEVLIFKE
jgi:beta-aspartyl-peptidase (threonine type)